MYRIMIADDEEFVRDLLAKNIRSSSLNVEVAAEVGDGREALKTALALKPDIVITDVSMPFINGLELIEKLQKAGINSKNIVISGYDEFNYARRAIALGVKNYLLKPFLPKELMDELRKLIDELDSQKILQQNMSMLKEQAQGRAVLARERAIKRLLEGEGGQESKNTDYRELGLDLSGNCYLAGVIRLTGNAWDFTRQEQVEEFLLLIREGYFPKGIRMYATGFDTNQLAAVWCGEEDRQELFVRKVKGGLEKILESLIRYYRIQFTCVLGMVCKDAEYLNQSYREAMAVWRRTLDMPASILSYDKKKEGGEKGETGTNSQIRNWKNQVRLSVRTGQTAEALEELQGLMKCYAGMSDKKNDYISVSISELVYDIQNDMETLGYDREELESDAAMLKRIHYGSLMDMKEILETYVRNCCAVVRKHSEETKAGAAVRQIKLLVDSNLKFPGLDLEWMASQVHFSQSYIRQIFKQSTKESFNEYVIRKRMEQAGLLLQKTNLRIQDVAGEYGYENQRYFASSFKKFYGCTPTEFKKIVEQDHLY